MSLDEWIEANDQRVDWSLFGEPWDSMQLKHNPFRRDQIDAILSVSDTFEKEDLSVLDLGCGPGILGRLILQKKPNAHYVGADGDPLMLTAMRHLSEGMNVQARLVDLRETDWARELQERFDSVISLTALHWLSKEHQKALYGTVFHVLKPGGSFVVGGPYLPEVIEDKNKLEALQSRYIQEEKGQTWEEYWQSFFINTRSEKHTLSTAGVRVTKSHLKVPTRAICCRLRSKRSRMLDSQAPQFIGRKGTCGLRWKKVGRLTGSLMKELARSNESLQLSPKRPCGTVDAIWQFHPVQC